MPNFASNIKIQNFKSIRKLELNDCKRINLFIGKPNVGKSNILEALSFFSLPYFYHYSHMPNLKEFIRIEEASELFFDGDTNKDIIINTDKDQISIVAFMEAINIHIDNNLYTDTFFYNSNMNLSILLEKEDNEQDIPLKKHHYKSYLFPKEFYFGRANLHFLISPYGQNLYDIVQSNKELKDEFLQIFKAYGLHLVFDKSSQELKIMKGVEKGEIFLIPFNSIADSLQRLIFYKTAIKSNKNSIITFEEPEAHTYPPYISQIAQDIIQAGTNQFFITTHSPYVVNEFLENAQDQLCIYMVDFKNGETVACRLTDSELDEVYNDGIDLFFNNEFFS